MALTLADLKEWFPMWEQALKEWNMQESRFVLKMKEEATLEAMRNALQRVLEVRFGVLPADLLHKIQAIKDLNRVDQLFEPAVRVNRPEDLSL